MKQHNTRKVRGIEVPSSTLTATATASHAVAAKPGLNRYTRRALEQKFKDADKRTVAEALISPKTDNTVWDDLEAKRQVCLQMLLSPSLLLPILRNKEIEAKIDNVNNVNILASLIAKDLLKFQLYHERISARHAGKTGGSMDPNDHMEAVMLFNEYVTFAEQFQANVIPNVQSLSEILARAEAKVVEESGAGALTETQEAFDAIAKGQFNVEFKDKTGPEASPEVAEPVH